MNVKCLHKHVFMWAIAQWVVLRYCLRWSSQWLWSWRRHRVTFELTFPCCTLIFFFSWLLFLWALYKYFMNELAFNCCMLLIVGLEQITISMDYTQTDLWIIQSFSGAIRIVRVIGAPYRACASEAFALMVRGESRLDSVMEVLYLALYTCIHRRFDSGWITSMPHANNIYATRASTQFWCILQGKPEPKGKNMNCCPENASSCFS